MFHLTVEDTIFRGFTCLMIAVYYLYGALHKVILCLALVAMMWFVLVSVLRDLCEQSGANQDDIYKWQCVALKYSGVFWILLALLLGSTFLTEAAKYGTDAAENDEENRAEKIFHFYVKDGGDGDASKKITGSVIRYSNGFVSIRRDSEPRTIILKGENILRVEY